MFTVNIQWARAYFVYMNVTRWPRRLIRSERPSRARKKKAFFWTPPPPPPTRRYEIRTATSTTLRSLPSCDLLLTSRVDAPESEQNAERPKWRIRLVTWNLVGMGGPTKTSPEPKPENTQQVCHFALEQIFWGHFLAVLKPILLSDKKFSWQDYHKKTNKKSLKKPWKSTILAFRPFPLKWRLRGVFKGAHPWFVSVSFTKFGRRVFHE